jgi:general secretion pathway protein D
VEFHLRMWWLSLACLVVAACSTSEPRTQAKDILAGPSQVLGAASSVTSGHPATLASLPIARSANDKDKSDYVEMGTGAFVDPGSRKQISVDDNGRAVTLNFVDVDIQEFARVVFEEVFKATVIIDPALKGHVTIRTASPVTPSVALEMVRQAVQATGASLTQSGAVYRISARGDQKNARQLGDSVRIVPVHYISVEDAKSALAPFVSTGVEVTAAAGGHYLVLSGPPLELDNLEQVLGTLDVDQLRGMSFALLQLHDAGASLVANELTQMFGKGNESHGFRALPITRMDAILVISPQPSLIVEARKWVSRLDRADKDGRRIYVYQLQNRRAADIAKILVAIVEPDRPQTASPPNQLTAPQLTPSTTTSPGSGFPASNFQSGFPTSSLSSGSVTGALGSRTSESTAATEAGRKTQQEGPRISPDLTTNSIVVIANADEWRMFEAALHRLDVASPEVLIEATIVEVTLNDSLNFGVQWFFQKGAQSTSLTSSTGTLNTTASPGFNYIFGLPNAQVIINALKTVTDVEIISSPALTVLDNQVARLQVGDQVPIATGSAQSTLVSGAPLVTNIDYKDTGVILAVTPHINASGLVMLDISQEVSDVVSTTTSTLNSPTIEQRRVNSTVSVRSGTEIVLGGLISSNRTKSSNGIPFLMDIPVAGNLFNSQATRSGSRTELLIFLRPTIMGTTSDVRNVVNEIKKRMSSVRAAMEH